VPTESYANELHGVSATETTSRWKPLQIGKIYATASLNGKPDVPCQSTV